MTAPIRFPQGHFLVYGESGSGKTTFWATVVDYYFKSFQEPSLVFVFDPPDMSTPYRDLGLIRTCEDKFYQDLGVPVEEIVDANGTLIVRLEFYPDVDPANPSACHKFERRLLGFYEEAKNWASVGLDSMTFLQHDALMRAKVESGFKMFEAGKDGRQWYAKVTEDIAILLFSRVAHWQTNVGVLCHVDENKDDFGELGILKTVALQGRMSKRAPSGFGEVYHMRIVPQKDVKGAVTYIRELQTLSDDRWVGKHTVTRAPNVCVPTYEALWENWRKAKEA